MLIINNEYEKLFLENTKATKYFILAFIYHDSVANSSNTKTIDKFINELKNAKKRGVDIKIICQSQKQLEIFRRYNFDVRVVKGFKTMHAKGWLFDMQTLIVGSHNFTENANTTNLEMSFLTSDIIDLQKYKNYFETIWRL
jgi:phosphatidylserine/phosphatidylglycerophosphate/cardiolipin synthase-like enzyme